VGGTGDAVDVGVRGGMVADGSTVNVAVGLTTVEVLSTVGGTADVVGLIVEEGVLVAVILRKGGSVKIRVLFGAAEPA
jgi:hypothetical protein